MAVDTAAEARKQLPGTLPSSLGPERGLLLIA